MSAAVDAYSELLPNIFRELPRPDVTSDRSVSVPAARLSAGVIMFPASAAVKPWRAKFNVASAASCIPNTELAAAVLMEAASFAASSSVDPMVAWTRRRVLSTSPNSLTDVPARPTIGIVTPAVRLVPTVVSVLPMVFSPADMLWLLDRLWSSFCAPDTAEDSDLSSWPAILIAISYSLAMLRCHLLQLLAQVDQVKDPHAHKIIEPRVEVQTQREAALSDFCKIGRV